MFLITPKGALYAAEDRNDPTRVLVRARDRKSLSGLAEWVHARFREPVGIAHSTTTDFPYRASVQRPHWAAFCADQAYRVNYPTFKGQCLLERPEIHRFVVKCWEASFDLEDEPAAATAGLGKTA